MPEIGIRELKAQASEIVRAVREQGAEYVITHRGRPVAMIVPFEDQPGEPKLSPDEWLAQIREIGRLLEAETPPGGRSALEQLFEDRAAS